MKVVFILTLYSMLSGYHVDVYDHVVDGTWALARQRLYVDHVRQGRQEKIMCKESRTIHKLKRMKGTRAREQNKGLSLRAKGNLKVGRVVGVVLRIFEARPTKTSHRL